MKKATPPKETVISEYDRRYSEFGELRDVDAFYRWVLNKLSPPAGKSLLDVACGEGHLIRFAQEMGLNACGVDFSSIAAHSTNRVVKKSVATIADGESLPFSDQSFDFVTNLGSLEHFISPENGLHEMRRILKPDGVAVLILPNSYYLWDIIWHVWRRGYPVSHRQVIERFATCGEWRDLIQTNGLSVVRTYKYNMCFPRTLDDWRWYAHAPQRMAYVIMSPFTPFNLSYSFLFICHRNVQ